MSKRIKALHTEAKRRAKRRGIAHSLTLADVQALFLDSEGRCQLSGIVFRDEIVKGNVRPYRASIDRIDSSEGYHLDNVRLVCIAVNLAMSCWGDIVLYTLVCAMLTKHMEIINVEDERPSG
jgi:hypothetical protein